jgi:hypothetical protein
MIDPSKMFASLLQSPLNFANMGGGASVGQTGGGAASMASMFSPAHMPWPLFAAAAQAQLAEMTAMKNAQLMHQQQQHTSTPTAASTPAVHMKPSPFMIASLLEAATHHQQQHNQQISPASQQTSRGRRQLTLRKIRSLYETNTNLNILQKDQHSVAVSTVSVMTKRTMATIRAVIIRRAAVVARRHARRARYSPTNNYNH